MDNRIQTKPSVIDSREVAEMVELRHDNLLKKIDKYNAILDTSKLRAPQNSKNKSKLTSLDFFIPSSYLSAQNKELPCYLLTKKGCEMVANKMTGEKGVLFTARYVTRFEQMEREIRNSQMQTLPNNYLEALEQLVDQVKQNEMLTIENGQLKMRLEENKISSLSNEENNKIYTVEEIARDNGTNPVALNKLLQRNRIQYRMRGRWYLYARYKNKGLCVEFRKYLKWTCKGRNFIEEILNK